MRPMSRRRRCSSTAKPTCAYPLPRTSRCTRRSRSGACRRSSSGIRGIFTADGRCGTWCIGITRKCSGSTSFCSSGSGIIAPMKRRSWIVPLFLLGLAAQLFAQPRHITSPKEQFGFNIGDDYRLVNYSQLEAYWKKLASESDRVRLVDIGTTAEGRHTWMAIISSPENHKNLAHYKEISQKLAAAEGVTLDQAQALARQGKAV